MKAPTVSDTYVTQLVARHMADGVDFVVAVGRAFTDDAAKYLSPEEVHRISENTRTMDENGVIRLTDKGRYELGMDIRPVMVRHLWTEGRSQYPGRKIVVTGCGIVSHPLDDRVDQFTPVTVCIACGQRAVSLGLDLFR